MNGKMWGLYKKELQVFFSMPVAYIVIIVFLIVSGVFFALITSSYAAYSMQAMQQYQRMQGIDLSILNGIFRSHFFNVFIWCLVPVIPLITMRLFAEEKREGTSELLFTYPINDFAILIAKYLSALTIYCLMLLGMTSGYIILRIVTAFEILPVLYGLLGLLLAGAAFIALGVFISAMTESQIAAAVISFGSMLFLMLLPSIGQSAGPGIGMILNKISMLEHFESFSKGLIDTADIVYYLNFVALFLFLTLRVLESKQWRG